MLQFILKLIGKLFFFTGAIEGAGFKKPLEKTEEDALIRLAKKGDENAREKLVEHNLRLVAHIAKKYRGAAETDDLLSVGSLGLAKAVDTFDPDKGTSLATFAARCIENEILMLLRADKKHKATVSLYDEVGTDKDGNALTILDTLTEDEDAVFSRANDQMLAEAVREKMKQTLTKREYVVIMLRYGVGNGYTYAQREVAKKLHISRSYVSRIEKKALLKLKAVIKKEDFSF